MFKLILLSNLALIVCVASGTTTMIKLSNQYYVSQFKTTFINSIGECRLSDRDLARVETQTAQTNIADLLSAAGLNITNVYWLGGVHLQNGAWIWLDTGKYLSYINWATNEPDVLDTTDYCLQMGKDYGDKASTQWEAQRCTQENYFICQTKTVNATLV